MSEESGTYNGGGATTTERATSSRTGPCAVIDSFRRALRSWDRQGYRLEFSHRHSPAGDCRVSILVHKAEAGGDADG